MYRLFWLFLLTSLLCADSLEKQIARMLISGIPSNATKLVHFESILQKYPLGGVIFLSKNLHSPSQVRELISRLRRKSSEPLWIALDEEGGKVDRLAHLKGIAPLPSAEVIARLSPQQAKARYRQTAKIMHRLGFDLNFAPVVDLARNPRNRVIVKAGRSYGVHPGKVVRYASVFIDAMQHEGIFCVLKHFPGHGSSETDSHEGFTDVTRTWDPVELVPFAKLIATKRIDFVMSAHIFNARLDSRYPATLSEKTITALLRKRLGFSGVVISDDLEMGAIRKNYDLNETLVRTIGAGVDMLLFVGVDDPKYMPDRLIHRIAALVRSGRIDAKMIEAANRRIRRLKYRKERDGR